MATYPVVVVVVVDVVVLVVFKKCQKLCRSKSDGDEI